MTTTPKTKSAAHAHHSAHPATRAAESPAQASAPIPAAIAAPAPDVTNAAIAAAAANTPNLALVAMPPSDANIPAPPKGFVATNATDYRGITPKKSELAVLPKAIGELQKFTDYAVVFGKTAPPLQAFIDGLSAALAWSEMRNATEAWDGYSRTMEGLAWTEARMLMEKARIAFDAATSTDATIRAENPSLTSLFNAATVIAQRGVATRKANAKSKAKGEGPVKGKQAAKARRDAKLAAQAEELNAPAAPQAGSAGPANPSAPATPPAANGAAH